MSRTRQRIEALVTAIRTEVTTTLLVEYGVRLSPATLERFKALWLKALNAAKLIGQLHAARPDRNDEPDDEAGDLADTRPMKTKPPPKH